MQDTSPSTRADCLQEERASVFQFKELFFPPPLVFSPFSSTVNVFLSGQIYEESQNDSYHLSVCSAGAARRWELPACVRARGVTAAFSNSLFLVPLSLWEKSLVTSKTRKRGREGEREGKGREKRDIHKPKYTGTTAPATKKVQKKKKKKETKSLGGGAGEEKISKPLCFQSKTF